MQAFNRLFKNRSRQRVFVLGLDCAAPELIFKKWRGDLPNLSRLMDQGAWGELESCYPCITVPAWACMLSGHDPGELGIYGFRNRADHSYDGYTIANSKFVNVKRVWDYAGDVGKQSIVIGVPQTYPVKPINGKLISGFLAPGPNSDFTYPPEFKKEVLAVAPNYDVDVRQFRTDDKDWLLSQIWTMTKERTKVVKKYLPTNDWDFFMMMEIGVDRIHHGFWSYMDSDHFRYEKGNKFENAIHDYYVYMDQCLGEYLSMLDDNTSVLVVSDHGAKRMDGGICINEWLWQKGYLNFKTEPKIGELKRLEDLEVDWSRTKAWGDGGYYGRVFFNVEGREPQGILPQAEYESFRRQLSAEISGIPDDKGNDIHTRVFTPEELYRSVKGVAPDLLVYFGDLLWRSVGTVGHGTIHTFDNDTGPDDCNHAQYGMAIMLDKKNGARGQFKNAQLMDVSVTALDLLGIERGADMQGTHLRDRISG